MPISIEPRRFGKHKIYHIILQEVRKQSLAATLQIHDVIDKNEHFHLQSTLCANVWTRAKGSNGITLRSVNTIHFSDPITFLELFHPIEILLRITKFFEFE